MEYLVRSTAISGGYITFEHPEESDAARCAVFQHVCVECHKPIDGPSVTFKTPSATMLHAAVYLVTVHLGRCSTRVQRRILASMKGS